MAIIQIKYSDIPAYLHAGEFYRSLDSEDPEGIIEVPVDCFHRDGLEAADLKDFHQLLRVMAFWILDEIPVGILNFCIRHEVDVWDQGISDLPGALKDEVQPLLLTVYSRPETVSFVDIIQMGRWDLIMHAVTLIAKHSPAARVAACFGNLRLLQYLHEHGFEWNEETCAEASITGHLDCLQYAHENGCPWDNMTTRNAAQEGHVDCLAYAHVNGCPWNTDVYKLAAQKGRITSMQYAFSQCLQWHTDVCRLAAFGGHLDCLQFAHENGCPWDHMTTRGAAQEGHLDCLAYALERDCPVNEVASYMACIGGHLGCLQLLRQFGASWAETTPYCAADSPSINCLQYLHENGCPWDEDTPDQAVRNEHIEPLKYALECGCPYYDNIVEWAARSSSLDCLQYLVEIQGIFMGDYAFKVALLRGDLTRLQYLLDQGCPFMNAQFDDKVEERELCDEIFTKDNPEFVLCVEFAVERGWVPCSNFIRYIVTRDEPCKQWLILKGHYVVDLQMF